MNTCLTCTSQEQGKKQHWRLHASTLCLKAPTSLMRWAQIRWLESQTALQVQHKTSRTPQGVWLQLSCDGTKSKP